MKSTGQTGGDLLLAVDVGNTNVVLGIFTGDHLVHHWRLATSVSRTADEAWIIFNSLCQTREVDIDRISGMAVCSVVPDMTSVFTDMAQHNFGIVPYEVLAETAPSVKIQYRDPSAVGPDRLCNAVAGFVKHGGPLIVVDYGTATTFDVINKEGHYLGGVITPGIELAQRILYQRAAQLPKVRLKFPVNVIGDTTESAMQSGLLYGGVDKLEGLCTRIWNELGQKGKIVATGGLSPLIAKHTRMIDAVEPFLVLEGLRILYDRHGCGN